MSSHNNNWEKEATSSPEYIALKEELRRKNNEIKELKESNVGIRALEGRIKALETERDILKDRLETLER